MGMGGNRELLDGKKWEWDLNFRWEWAWDGNGNEVTEMGGNWDENQFPHTSSIDLHIIWKVRPRNALTDCWCICRGHTAFD